MKSLMYYISIFWVALTLVGCSNKSNSSKEHLVFRYNESANIQTLDPAFARNMAIIWPCNQLFNTLVRLDDNLEIQPDIAKSYSISDDGLIYEFILRDDVYFHPHKNFGVDSTRTVKASDIVYSLNRLNDPELSSPGGWVLQDVKHFEALNDSVFRVELKAPSVGFLGLLSMRYASVVPPEVVEDKQHDFRSNPIGTGPFYFKYWQENVKLVLRKNNKYFQKDSNNVRYPYLEAVSVTFLADKQSAFLQFLQGKLDFVSGLDPSYKDDVLTSRGELQPRYEGRVKMITGPYLNTEYLGINMQNPPEALEDHRVREALNIGFDRHKMVQYLRNAQGQSNVGGIIPDGLSGQSGMKVSYDVERAKHLIAQYKSSKGKDVVRLTLSTNSSYIDIAQYLQREWHKIGVELEVDVLPAATLRQGIASGKIGFFRASWIADYPEAENYLALLYSKNHPSHGPNYTRFDHSGFDFQYESALASRDKRQRITHYALADSIVAKELPVIVLFYDQAIRFTHPNVDNLGINAMNNLFLQQVAKRPVN